MDEDQTIADPSGLDDLRTTKDTDPFLDDATPTADISPVDAGHAPNDDPDARTEQLSGLVTSDVVALVRKRVQDGQAEDDPPTIVDVRKDLRDVPQDQVDVAVEQLVDDDVIWRNRTDELRMKAGMTDPSANAQRTTAANDRQGAPQGRLAHQDRYKPSSSDRISKGVSHVGRLLTSLLWGVGGFAAFSEGEPLFGLLALAYLAYLWLFGGRWLIY